MSKLTVSVRTGVTLLMLLGIFLNARPARAQGRTVAERLGLPGDSKLLIVHGDDLAVAHSVDRATFAALEKKAISSASIMVPCPWLTEVAAYAREHPAADLGIHLTLTSEWKTYRWGPVAATDQVPSLLDPAGDLWADTGSVGKNVKPEDAEREICAQVERAIKLGIRPTHLDNHMGSLFARPELFAAFVKVAREYHLPFLAVRLPNAPHQMLAMLTEQDIVLDSVISAHEGVLPGEWKEYYAGIIRTLKPGLTELIVHLGYNDDELKAITADHPGWGAEWRQRDFDVVTSPDFRKLVEENHVTVVG